MTSHIIKIIIDLISNYYDLPLNDLEIDVLMDAFTFFIEAVNILSEVVL